MSAIVFVPAGTAPHASGGEVFAPAQVCSTGIASPSLKAVLVSDSVTAEPLLLSVLSLLAGCAPLCSRRHAAQAKSRTSAHSCNLCLRIKPPARSPRASHATL